MDEEFRRDSAYCSFPHESDVKVQRAKEEACIERAVQQYTKKRQDGSLKMVLGIDLASIVPGWLIVWGCVLVIHWIHRGFVAP
jgi:hypothetical protein